VYLELHNVFEDGWSAPLEVYFDLGCDLHFEMRDGLDKPIPQAPVAINGFMPYPYHIILPCDATIRLRADIYTVGRSCKSDGLEVCGRLIPPNATNDFFLSATLVALKDRPSPIKYLHVWEGTLKLPKVKIPVKKQ
jgi:hypothetical protein